MDITQFHQLYDYDSNTFITDTGRHQPSGIAISHEMSTVVYKDDTSVKVKFSDDLPSRKRSRRFSGSSLRKLS